MAILAQSYDDSTNGITANSQKKQSGNFDRWKRFLSQCGIEDKFLTKFLQKERICLICAFAASVRRNEYGKQHKTRLCHGTVSAAIGNVCSTFRTNFRNDPSLDSSGLKSMFLTRLLKGYKNLDPAPRQQKCLPIIVYNHM